MKKLREIWIREIKKHIRKWQLKPNLGFGGNKNG
tara:strand:- start:342 stop:443 length:102 start_codon:yes stop_codon:yes gene_type:complete